MVIPLMACMCRRLAMAIEQLDQGYAVQKFGAFALLPSLGESTRRGLHSLMHAVGFTHAGVCLIASH